MPGPNILALHWNGHIWSQVPSQGPASGLTGVTALSASDAWAVGTDMAGTLVLHWNGHTWSQVPSPSPGSAHGSLAGVSADSPSDAWAVGCDCLPSFCVIQDHPVHIPGLTQ